MPFGDNEYDSDAARLHSHSQKRLSVTQRLVVATALIVAFVAIVWLIAIAVPWLGKRT